MTRKSLVAGAATHAPVPRKEKRLIEDERFFTIADVAEFVGMSARTVRRWIKNGELVAHRFGTAVRIAESDLKAFTAQHRGL